MSATGRGERGGGGHDYFATPAYCVDWLLRAVDLPGGNWLEPSAGDGAIIRAVNARRTDVRWSAVELRAEMRPALFEATGGPDGRQMLWYGDFLAWAPEVARVRTHAVCIGNVPYNQAAAHVGMALQVAPVVAMLLRLNFLGSAKRLNFWRHHPADVYVLSERPSFDGEGTDATEYAWFVWGQCGTHGKVQVLGPPETADLFDDTRTQSPA